MGRGRKPKNELPTYIQLSEDGKKVQCTLCNTGQKQKNAWILKDSLPSHLKSVLHDASLKAERARDAVNQAVEQAMEEERELEEADSEFVELSLTTVASASATRPVQKRSLEEREMWEDYASSAEMFDAGIDHQAAALDERKRLEQEANDLDVWDCSNLVSSEDPNDTQLLFDELEQDDIMTELLQNACSTTSAVDDLMNGQADYNPTQSKASDAWSPYESKILFLLDTLDNLPRMRISNSLMNVFLWVLREAGAPNVPSLFHLRKVQASLRKSSGIPTMQCKSPKGNVYSMNDPRALVSMDWANPTVCNHIHRYPVIPPNGVISEVYHAGKWRIDVDRHMLSPMYDAGECHYYIDELARLKDGNFIIPVRWLEDSSGHVFADAFAVAFDEQSLAHVVDSPLLLIDVSNLQNNFLDLTEQNLIPAWHRQTIDLGYPALMPNPDRALAKGDPLYTSWIDIFGDDVSGNRSKSWNKHWNVYISHRNLPRKLLQQEFHVHFVSTSPVASIAEQFHGIKKLIESTHKQPVKVRHGSTGVQTRFKLYVNCGPGDNPAQSEVCGHIGANGNHPCRKCLVGGPQQVKESDVGYHELFQAGAARTARTILSDIDTQVSKACLGVAQTVHNEQTKNGVKDAYIQFWIDDLIKRARTLRKNNPERSAADIQAELLDWVKVNKDDIYNPFLSLDGFDPAIDTPVEILHTILLGIVKYLWHGSHTSWTAQQKETYAIRLQSTERSGLSIHAIRANYIMQYANSLIGRQFKTLAQVNVFHVYDLVDSNRFLLTKAVGELAALLWVPEIQNMEEYLSDIDICVANVLDLFAAIDPSKIVSKIKLHLLTHLKDDIRRFGPIVGVATEVFECFNAIFRYCSIYSNHLAPSRDIAFQMGRQEVLKHRLTGGWSLMANEEWQRPGPSIRTFMDNHPTLQALVGWTSTEPIANGSFRLEPLKSTERNKQKEGRKYSSWSQTAGSKALNHTSEDPNSQWTACRYTVARSGDKCSKGSWVFARSNIYRDQIITGRIDDILATSDGKRGVVVLDLFQVLSKRHETFNMPMLARRQDERTYVVIPTTDIDFLYNVQHDCPLAKCAATGKQTLMQERVESGVIRQCIEHKPLERFVINTHAFHNAHLLRSALPRSLVAPVPLHQARQEKHFDLAKNLRASRQATAKARAEQKKRESMKVADETEPGSSIETDLDMATHRPVDAANPATKRKQTKALQAARPGPSKRTRLNVEMDEPPNNPGLATQQFRFVAETGLPSQ